MSSRSKNIADRWQDFGLPAKFEDSTLSVLKLFNPDRGTADTLVESLRIFAEIDARREQVDAETSDSFEHRRRRAPAHLDGRRRQFALHRRRTMHQIGSLASIVPKSRGQRFPGHQYACRSHPGRSGTVRAQRLLTTSPGFRKSLFQVNRTNCASFAPSLRRSSAPSAHWDISIPCAGSESESCES